MTEVRRDAVRVGTVGKGSKRQQMMAPTIPSLSAGSVSSRAADVQVIDGEAVIRQLASLMPLPRDWWPERVLKRRHVVNVERILGVIDEELAEMEAQIEDLVAEADRVADQRDKAIELRDRLTDQRAELEDLAPKELSAGPGTEEAAAATRSGVEGHPGSEAERRGPSWQGRPEAPAGEVPTAA